MWLQRELSLAPKARGFHLITGDVLEALPELVNMNTGLLNLFIQHTSASLTINENADPSVRRDFESVMSHLVPENKPWYSHTLEGPDDLPAHIKASLLGPSLTIPVTRGALNLGVWQGV